MKLSDLPIQEDPPLSELCKDLIMAHRYLYYIKTAPVLSDVEYDKLEKSFKGRKDLPIGSDIPASYSPAQIRLAGELRRAADKSVETEKEDIEAEVDEAEAELEEDLYDALDLLRGCLPILDRMLWFDRTDQILSKGDRENLMDLNAELVTFLSQWED